MEAVGKGTARTAKIVGKSGYNLGKDVVKAVGHGVGAGAAVVGQIALCGLSPVVCCFCGCKTCLDASDEIDEFAGENAFKAIGHGCFAIGGAGKTAAKVGY
jgi:uncharacterized ferredoxin-like protein